MRDFCPLCLRGGMPEYCSTSCSSVDSEQAECSRLLKGLPLLDLGAPGRRCINSCRITCVICGHAAIFGCEPEFENLIDAMEQHQSDLLEARVEVLEGLKGFVSLGKSLLVDLERRFRRVLSKTWGLGWHSRFQRVVHPHCVKRGPCGCDLSFCTSTCMLHGERRVLKGAPSCKPAPVVHRMEPELELANRKATPFAFEPAAQKATWLAQPSKLATVALRAETEYTSAITPASKRPKPAPSKPDERLQVAASGCRPLDAWAGKQDSEAPLQRLPDPPAKKKKQAKKQGPIVPSCAQLGAWVIKTEVVAKAPRIATKVEKEQGKKSAPEPAPSALQTPAPPSTFSRFRHFRDFDPFQHGYWRVNNRDVYRFPDGRQVPICATMHLLTETGELEPG